jgi:hypothetical protein
MHMPRIQRNWFWISLDSLPPKPLAECALLAFEGRETIRPILSFAVDAFHGVQFPEMPRFFYGFT